MKDRAASPWPPPALSHVHTLSCTKCLWGEHHGPGPVLPQSHRPLPWEHTGQWGEGMQSTTGQTEDAG